MKTALVYDRINKWGGAERVLLALHEIFPDAPLYTSLYNAKTAPWAKVFKIKTSFLQNIPYAASNHELLSFMMPIAFEQFNFDEFDMVISVTSEAAKGIITKPRTKHICYCLTPTRYLWSGYETYFNNKFLKTISYPAVLYLRKWDKIAAMRPDIFVALSKEVQGRIKKYYGRDSELIYPALSLNSQNLTIYPQKSTRHKPSATGYFLVVSRLSKFTRYKRIDLAIKACNELNLPLKIIGTGNWEPDLKAMSGPAIEFLGSVSDDTLIEYYRHCKAFIFPGIEDFGLTIIEAQKYGKPVIAYRGGGALETVLEGKTGLFFDNQDYKSLLNTLKRFDDNHFKSMDCMKQAEKFNFTNFKSKILSLVEKTI